MILYGCGPRPPAQETHVRKPGNTATTLTSALNVTVKDRVQLAFHVTNDTPRSVELNFPSGHTHDFTVTDTTGRELWKWSQGRLFTQAMQNKVIDRGSSASWQADWNPGDLHGTFVAVVSLNSENHPMEQRTRFEIP